MQVSDGFKKRYARRPEDGFRDRFFAVCASIAVHVGIALALITATAMSAGLTLWGDPVIHVSLISMSAAGSNSEVSHTPKATSPEKGARQVLEKRAAETVSIDKQVGNKIKMETTLPELGKMYVMNSPAAAVGLNDLKLKGMAKGMADDTNGQMDIALNGLSSQVSMAVPRYRDNSHPVYPQVARLKGYEGVVLLSAEIHADGQVGELRLKKSSGFVILDRSALEAVKKMEV